MEPSSQPPPLPPISNQGPYSPSASRKSSNTTPSPRIRRKPLPATAFSPTSIVSSPISIYSRKEENTTSNATPAGLALNNVLTSPTLRPNITRSENPLPEPISLPLTLPISTADPRNIPKEVPIPDFPLPPQHEVVSHQRLHEVPHTSVKDGVDMAVKTIERPPPLRMESIKAVKALDAKKPQSPGSVFTSFFTRRPAAASPNNTSPGGESSATDISDTRSPSPFPTSGEETSYFPQQRQPINPIQRQSSWKTSQSSINNNLSRRMDSGSSPSYGQAPSDLATRCNTLEAELREISRELAGSIRRELDLEDLVERLQSEAPRPPMSIDRTSDYFSDSGASSTRHATSEYNYKEEVDKIKRDSEQQRAQLRVDLSQKWQQEAMQRKNLESHVQILENKLSQNRQTTNETTDASVRIKELEISLDDARRRLVEERQTKENFEDLLTALRVELEQHRNERDNLRDEVIPNLQSRIDGFESTFGETQKQAYDFARMQQEIQSLKDENAAISSARKMEQEMMRSGMNFHAEDGIVTSRRSSLIIPKSPVLNRSSTISMRGQSPALGSGPLSRSNSILNRALPDTPDNIAEKLTAVEQQRDALHSAMKSLRSRYEHQTRTYEKKVRNLEAQIEKLGNTTNDSKRGGYEKEVRALRQEINLLRKRADDAMDQKWQCEKGLSGLKMDLDRSKQETASLQRLLQARNSDDPELLSTGLENAMKELQQTRAQSQDTVASLAHEQKFSDQLKESAKRSEALAIQVRQQLEANSSLRTRLISAVQSGEQNQHASAAQISTLQLKLKKLEDTITVTQLQSETAVMKHEDEVRTLKASHNAQLMRAKAGLRSPTTGPTQASPLSPMFALKSPKLDNTSSGPGMALNQVLKTEFLEKKVAELEKALRDAEGEMGAVVGRMNKAQIEVFELQQERDEEHKRTRRLEAEVKAERERFQELVNNTTN